MVVCVCWCKDNCENGGGFGVWVDVRHGVALSPLLFVIVTVRPPASPEKHREWGMPWIVIISHI